MMRKYTAISGNFLIKTILILFYFILALAFFFLKDEPKIIGRSDVSLFAGNVGIGESSPDTTPPFVNLTSPTTGSSVSGLVDVRAEASDSGGIASITFFVDTGSIGTDTSAPYSALWDTTVYPHNSQHTILANAFDTSGNQASSSAVFVTVLDITSPSVTITNPLDGSTVPKNSTVTITANASDISGINKVEFYINGVLKCTDTTSAYTCNSRVPPRKNVTYTLQAKGYDIAGNTNTATVTVISK